MHLPISKIEALTQAYSLVISDRFGPIEASASHFSSLLFAYMVLNSSDLGRIGPLGQAESKN